MLSFEISAPLNNQQANTDDLMEMKYLKVPTAVQTISIKFNHENPRCLPDFRQRSRDLKKVLQELNIAPWQRKRIPFIYYDNTLVCAVGYFVCKEYLAKESELSIVLSWQKGKIAQ